MRSSTKPSRLSATFPNLACGRTTSCASSSGLRATSGKQRSPSLPHDHSSCTNMWSLTEMERPRSSGKRESTVLQILNSFPKFRMLAKFLIGNKILQDSQMARGLKSQKLMTSGKHSSCASQCSTQALMTKRESTFVAQSKNLAAGRTKLR
jgi:hypothetical protein